MTDKEFEVYVKAEIYKDRLIPQLLSNTNISFFGIGVKGDEHFFVLNLKPFDILNSGHMLIVRDILQVLDSLKLERSDKTAKISNKDGYLYYCHINKNDLEAL